MNANSRNPKTVLLKDVNQGGAAIAARRLAAGMRGISWEVDEWSFAAGADEEVQFTNLDPLPRRPPLERLLKNLSKPIANRLRRQRHEKAFQDALAKERPALLNIHNLHASGLGHAALLRIPRDIKLVWTMHDCRVFAPHAFQWRDESGREVFQAGEERAEKGARERRQFFEARPDVVLVSPSRWLAAEAKRAVPAGIRVEVIPYSLPTEVFQPSPRAEARRALGLPGDKVLIGFAAATFDSRKGGDVLIEAVKRLKSCEVELVVWGRDEEGLWPDSLPIQRMGDVREEKKQALLYSACDIFACPSRIDNLPNTLLESMACGTPMVGSAVGGIPELVRPGESGWLYEGNSPGDCARALKEALREKASWPAYARRCRAVAEAEFQPQKQARGYAALFGELVKPA